LISLDVDNNTELLYLQCQNNHLTLKNLYALSKKINVREDKQLGPQTATPVDVELDEYYLITVDTLFGTPLSATRYSNIRVNGNPATASDYAINGNHIVFFKNGFFTLEAGHDSIVSDVAHPAVVVHTFNTPAPFESDAEIVVYWNRILSVANPDNQEELRNATYQWFRNGVSLAAPSRQNWIEIGTSIPAGLYSVSIVYGGREILNLERNITRPFGISASPNPLNVAETLTVQADSETKIKHVEVFDMFGNLQKSPSPHINFKKSGMYILRVHLENDSVETLKITVK
jgi:hypothetical protein